VDQICDQDGGFSALLRFGSLYHRFELSREDGFQEPEFGFIVFFRDLEIREAFGFLPVIPFSLGVREGKDLAGLAVFLGLHFVLLVFVCRVCDVDG
jgi:hypothetical protein